MVAELWSFLLPITANCGPPSPYLNGHIVPYTSTIEGTEVTYVFWTVDQTQYQPVCKQTKLM